MTTCHLPSSVFFFSSRRRHTRWPRDWSSDVCSSDLLLADPQHAAAGLATFGLLAGISFAGNGLAIVLTPLAHERMSPSSWVVVCLGSGALSRVVMAIHPDFGMIAAAAILMGLAVQGAKIAVDTIVQADTADAYRGRAFSLYDTLYNGAFAGAAALAALVLPNTGYSRATFVSLAVVYVVLAVGYRLVVRHLGDQPRTVPLTTPR